jgi:hypothetical protein
MADQDILSPNSLPKSISADPVMGMVMKSNTDYNASIDDINKRKSEALAPVNKDIENSSKEISSMSEKGPDLVATPENKAKRMDAGSMAQAFSVFMALGALAGKSTKAPMTAALNNMTGALKGLQEGDEEQYKKATDEFNNNFAKAAATNKARIDEYNRIFAAKNTTIAEKIRQADLISKQYGDELTALNLKSGNLKDVFSNIRASENLQQKAEFHVDEMGRFDADRKERAAEHASTLAETSIFHNAEQEHWKEQSSMRTGTLEYKLAEVSKLEDQGVLTKEEAQKRKDTLISGTRGAKLGEERSAMQSISLNIANKKIEELQSKGQKMPLLGDIHIGGDGIASAVGRYGIKRELTPDEQMMVTAAQVYAEAAGHLESGARLTQSAFDRVVRQYLPQPGDSTEVSNLKSKFRSALSQGAKVLSGPLAGKMDGTSDPASAAQGAAESKTINGVTYQKVNGQWMQ